MQLITVATCSLNQWALDFAGNKQRIIESITKAKQAGASLRIGPELEITGYGCLDHFLELDLYDHSWEVLRDILLEESCREIYFHVGMPIRHKTCYYNCQVACYNGQILYIRPKMDLANDGNFREMRYFTAWDKRRDWVYFDLPPLIREAAKQQSPVPFGYVVTQTSDTVIGVECCEELFTPDAPNIHMGLDGVEIFTNSSGSHHELRKLNQRMELIQEATRKSKGVYLYANQQGCDGDRLYYDGCASIIVNGEIVAQGSQFSLRDVEVITATLDLDEVRSARFAPSRRAQASQAPAYKRIVVNANLCYDFENQPTDLDPSRPRSINFHCPEGEISLGPACWLWDYLRRSKQTGLFLPLSGGIDSCSTAVIVHSMCRLVKQSIDDSNQQVIEDIRRMTGEPDNSSWVPDSSQEVCSRIFHTCFMGTTNSSGETRNRAKELAASIGSYHIDMDMDDIVKAFTATFTRDFDHQLKYKTEGGTVPENIALQNIQSRSRMVYSYLCAQTIPFIRQMRGDRRLGGNLLVLGSANVDESLRGYLTKYDCSSADLNPIGGISKTDLKRFIQWAKTNFDLPVLDNFLTATPTAELEPITATYVQSDEADMGTTYADLSTFGTLRKVKRLGPWGQFKKLCQDFTQTAEKGGSKSTPRQILDKVIHFNHYYSINRHKMTTLTPALHCCEYSPDDNRFDLRPFLYPRFNWQYDKIERFVLNWEKKNFKT